MQTTDRPRKRHAAQRSRWATAALATAGTIGITGYLQFVHPAAATTSDTQLSDLTTGQYEQAQIPVLPPPAPSVTVKVRHKPKPGAAPTTAPAAVAPVYPQVPRPQTPQPQVQVQPRPLPPKPQISHATTRGSNG